MAKVGYDSGMIDEMGKALTTLASRVAAIKKEMTAKHIPTIKLNFEKRKERGMSDLDKWVTEAELEMSTAVLRASKK